MKILTLLFAGFVVLALPNTASAAEQCTTSQLDLVCDEGEVLQGISANGDKICVTATASTSLSGDLYECPYRVDINGNTNTYAIYPERAEEFIFGSLKGDDVSHNREVIPVCNGQITRSKNCKLESWHSNGKSGREVITAYECRKL